MVSGVVKVRSHLMRCASRMLQPALHFRTASCGATRHRSTMHTVLTLPAYSMCLISVVLPAATQRTRRIQCEALEVLNTRSDQKSR